MKILPRKKARQQYQREPQKLYRIGFIINAKLNLRLTSENNMTKIPRSYFWYIS